MARFNGYQKRLLIFLGAASFFEGYDFLALSQLLPNLRSHFGLTESQGGTMVALVNVGTIMATLLIRAADRIGRARVLAITIAGYTISSLASGFAPDVYTFTIAQAIARFFLIAEWAVAMVIAAEEFPAEDRGLAIGIIQALTSLGAITCAGLVPLLVKLPYGWRSVYFVGAVPLILLAFARRSMRETQAFTDLSSAEGSGGSAGTSLFSIWSSPYRNRMLWVALTWGLCYICTQSGVTYWKEFAIAERGLSEGQVGFSVSVAAVGAMPLAFASGKMLDVLGRKKSAAVIMTVTAFGTAAAYSVHSHWGLTLALAFAIFGTTAVLQVMNAFTTELFPTRDRAGAFAWSNNLLGRVTYVLAPYMVAVSAEQFGWGPAVRVAAFFPMVALGVIWLKFPETKGKDLQELSLDKPKAA